MSLAYVQRADVLRPEPSQEVLFQVVGIDHQVGAPSDPVVRFRPIYGGAGQSLTLSAFNARYPQATIESRDDTAATLH